MVGISFTAGVLFLVQPWPTVGFKVVQSWWWVLGSCGLSLAFSKDEPTSKHGKSSELWLTTLKRMKLCCNLFLHAWILLLFQRNPSIGRIKGYKQIFIPTRIFLCHFYSWIMLDLSCFISCKTNIKVGNERSPAPWIEIIKKNQRFKILFFPVKIFFVWALPPFLNDTRLTNSWSKV